jgi:gliding motility-associated-like protein
LKRLIYILLILFIATQNAWAQPYSACFNFETLPARGCAPLTVKAISCSGASNPQYKWGDGTVNSNPIHTYSTVGTYTVTQLVATGVPSPTTDQTTQTVQVVPITPPNFKILICSNLVVGVQTLDNVYDKYVIDWGDGSFTDTINGNSNINHSTTSGTKNISVKGIYTTGCSSAPVTTSVTPLQQLVKPDIINLIVNRQADGNNGQITLNLKASPGQKYYLQQSTGSNSAYTTIADLGFPTTNSILVSNLNTLSNQYCFRFRSYDDCGHDSTSEEICSIIMKVTPQNNQNLVSWSPFMGSNFGKYTVSDGNGGNVSPAPNPYTDNTNIICNNQYCYYIVADLTELNSFGNPIQSISSDSCITAISNNVPPPVQNLNSTITGNSVSLTWDVPVFNPPATQYRIWRSVNGGLFDSTYAVSNTNSYSDNGVDVKTDHYCYMVDYIPCTQASTLSYTTCPVLLTGNETGGININWTSYVCSSGVPDYSVERLDPNTNVVISSVDPSSSPFQDTQADPNAPVLKYRIKTSCPTSAASYSNIFEINHEMKLFFPDAFTPDGDGNNDFFIAKGNYIKDFKMTIFNRWGEVVFSTDQFGTGWDGKYKGEIASMDAYAYTAEATDNFGNKLRRRGTVTLLR